MSGNSEGEEWEPESDAMTQTIAESWWGRNLKGSVGPGGGKEGNDWGYGQVPSEGRSGTDKRNIGSGNGPDVGKSGRPGDSVDEWKEEEPARCLQSTKTQLVGECVLCQMPGGKMRPKC